MQTLLYTEWSVFPACSDNGQFVLHHVGKLVMHQNFIKTTSKFCLTSQLSSRHNFQNQGCGSTAFPSLVVKVVIV
uniref:Ovule protein n=1 Tax=Romanomermis culicivorax TaxID=13658 RepID=A0A915I2E5_ROMCU